MIFISVDLPAPFSPSTAWISPGATLQADAVVGLHGRVLLADVDQLEAKHGRAPVGRLRQASRRVGSGSRRRRTPRPGCVRRPASSTRRPAHASRAPPRARRAATGPTAQSQTQTSAMRPARASRSRRRGRAPRAAPRVAACSAFQAVSRSPAQRLHLVGVGHRAQHRQAGAAADVARQADAARPRPRRARQPNRPLPRNRFDDGLCAICAPARGSAARSASSSQMPCAKHAAFACSRPARRVDVEVAARLGEQLAHPGAPRRGSRPRGSACRALGSAAQRRPAIASCSGELVGAKRTVTA